MDIIHVYVKLKDLFSGAVIHKISTQSLPTFEKMKAGIGSTFEHFDKKAQIHSTLKVIEVRQAIQSDYSTSKI